MLRSRRAETVLPLGPLAAALLVLVGAVGVPGCSLAGPDEPDEATRVSGPCEAAAEKPGAVPVPSVVPGLAGVPGRVFDAPSVLEAPRVAPVVARAAPLLRVAPKTSPPRAAIA